MHIHKPSRPFQHVGQACEGSDPPRGAFISEDIPPDGKSYNVVARYGNKIAQTTFSFCQRKDEALMKTLIACLVLSGCCFAQTANVSDIQGAGDFVRICGHEPTQLSPKSVDTVSKAPNSSVMDTINKAMRDADHLLCLGYLAGMVEGWREGHERGVLITHFPTGIPSDLTAALKSLSDREFKEVGRELESDVPCLEEHITMGEMLDTMIKHIRAEFDKNPLMKMVPTSRIVSFVLPKAFPCK
jgi:hypothetical protein